MSRWLFSAVTCAQVAGHWVPGRAGLGSEDHVVRSLCAACDMSAERGAPLRLLCQPRLKGAITQER